MGLVMLQFLSTILVYAYFGFLVVGYYLLTFCSFILELAGFRREDPAFEGDKLGYRS